MMVEKLRNVARHGKAGVPRFLENSKYQPKKWRLYLRAVWKRMNLSLISIRNIMPILFMSI